MMYEDSSLSDDYTVSSEISVTSDTSLDTSSISDSSYSEVSYDIISEKLDTLHSDLTHIGQGVDHIFICALLLVAFKSIWTIFDKWYFGGV